RHIGNSVEIVLFFCWLLHVFVSFFWFKPRTFGEIRAKAVVHPTLLGVARRVVGVPGRRNLFQRSFKLGSNILPLGIQEGAALGAAHSFVGIERAIGR